jgi:hypothetical protein
MTGGGPVPVESNDPVMDYMDPTNANLDVEVDCTSDSTAVFEKQCKHYTYIRSTRRTILIFLLQQLFLTF